MKHLKQNVLSDGTPTLKNQFNHHEEKDQIYKN